MTINGKEKMEPHLVSGNSANGTSRAKQLLNQIGGETGKLGPLVKMLNKLMDDPILKKTLDSSAGDTSNKH